MENVGNGNTVVDFIAMLLMFTYLDCEEVEQWYWACVQCMECHYGGFNGTSGFDHWLGIEVLATSSASNPVASSRPATTNIWVQMFNL